MLRINHNKHEEYCIYTVHKTAVPKEQDYSFYWINHGSWPNMDTGKDVGGFIMTAIKEKFD